MRIYLAGPMSGIESSNYPAFNKAAKKLRLEGHWVCNPAELNPETDDYRKALAVDLAWICSHAEVIALLPGWEASKGAGVEFALAKALDLKFLYL